MRRSINGWTSSAGRGRRQGRARSSGWKAWMVALGLLSACGPETVPHKAELHDVACDGTPVLEGVRYLHLRVTGEGMEPIERYERVEGDTDVAPILPVPGGRGRVLEVRGYTDLPRSGGRLVSLGRSRPFNVLARLDAPSRVSVPFLRVGEYVHLGRGADTSSCGSLASPRAGHTATLLEDGRVLLAGGFQTSPEGSDTTVSSAEIVDPLLGTVKPLPSVETPRAFHTATRLPGGKVLLAGGELNSVEGSLPVQSAQVLDVDKRTSTEVRLNVARSHHAAAVDSGGRVLLVGGVGAGSAVVSEAEGFDSATGQVFSVSSPVPRVGMSVMPVGDGQRIAVVGGSDGTSLRPEVLFFSYQGGSFAPVGEGARLREPRRDAALVPFGGPEQLLYVGGHDSPGTADASGFLASSEVVSPGEPPRVTAGPQVFARSGLCAVSLPDGRVMTLGGLRYNSGTLGSDSHVELLVPGKDGAAPALLGLMPLQQPRQHHTCTVLDDGSVLIAGGLDENGSRRTTLGDLLIYMPAPLD